MRVGVAGKGETEGKWEVASLCCHLYYSFASVATFCSQTPIPTWVRLVVRVCGGGFRTAGSIASHPSCFLPLPCSASGHSDVLCISSLF